MALTCCQHDPNTELVSLSFAAVKGKGPVGLVVKCLSCGTDHVMLPGDPDFGDYITLLVKCLDAHVNRT